MLDHPLEHLAHTEPAVRRLALAACKGRLHEPGVRAAVLDHIDSDPDGAVRAAAAEVLAEAGEDATTWLLRAAEDDDSRVVEAAATALGETGSSSAVPWLIQAARSHADRLVREAAVAALGAIGHPDAVDVLLDLLVTGPPQVRRRAAVALTVFDHAEIEPALRRARADRNPMVREVAEMIVGRAVGGEGDAAPER